MRAVVVAGPFEIGADEPRTAGGEGSHAQPTDLFLASIASCFTLAMAFVADRRGHDLTGLRVRVTGTYDGPRFSRIAVEVSCSAPEHVVAELLPEAQRVCYVTNTLREPPNLDILVAPTTSPDSSESRRRRGPGAP
jgi:putative redox protein